MTSSSQDIKGSSIGEMGVPSIVSERREFVKATSPYIVDPSDRIC
jgi:hypothetical protein